jgi:hypothetical protein
MPEILPRAREGFLKIALALAVGACLVPAGPAAADELLVGALRDQDGAAVAGASVTALDASGAVVARDRSAADGTFALTVPARPSAVLVAAPDAEPLRLAVPADGSPLGGIVRRHRAASLIPSAADVAALPAGLPSELASVVPYRVTFPGLISDRWLSQGHGVTTVEGLAFYRRGDGGDTSSLLPAHAAGALEVRDPLQAPWYGDRGGGGVIDLRLFDRADAARVTTTDGAIALGRDAALLAATSSDAGGARRLVALQGSQTFGPVSAHLVALAGDTPAAHYAGAGADLRASTRTLDLGARLAFTRDDGTAALRDDGTVVDFTFDAAARGPNAIVTRLRARYEHGVLGDVDAQHRDAALVLGTSRGNVVRLSGAVALAYGDESSYDIGTAQHTFAVLPSLSLDAPLGAQWSFHAGAGASSLGTPGYAIARGSLGEAGLAYADHRRFRADLLAYSEGDAAPSAVNRGLAASFGWEIAPRLSLRAWSVRDADEIVGVAAYPGGPTIPVDFRERFDRDVVWLTWDAPARFDVLLRAGFLEANARLPLSRRYALTIGSFVQPNARRLTTFGLVAR